MRKNGFGLIELLVVMVAAGLFVGGGWYVTRLESQRADVVGGLNAETQANQAMQKLNEQTQQEQQAVTDVAATPSPTSTPRVASGTDVSNPQNETIDGVAYLSPNAGEGLSVKYTETIQETNPNNPYETIPVVYHPFQPLEHYVGSATTIRDKEGRAISLKSIKIGDRLIVHLSVGPCIAGVQGGPSGCNTIIFSIQDLSL